MRRSLALLLLAACATPPATTPDGVDPVVRPERPLDAGRVTVRRLNNSEYDNTVRDLLLTDLRPAGELFPVDDSAHGWDNMADALSLSPLHIEMYEQAADTLIAVELADPHVEPVESFYEAEGDGVVATTGGVSGDFYNLWSRGSLTADLTIETPGTYVLTARLGATQGGPALARAAFLVDDIAVREVDVPGQREFDTWSVEVELTRGIHNVGVSFLNDYYDSESGADRNLLVDWFSLEGPQGVTGEPTRARARYYTCNPADADEDACAAEILDNFAARAWRRPPDAEGSAMLRAVYDDARADGADWEQAVHNGIKAAMLSPRFVFRLELDESPTSAESRPLDAYELANRLSYFLWRTMPDDILMEKAADGSLLQDDVLLEEVERLLGHPNADTLVSDYAGQWLNIRAIADVEPDYALFPDFDDALRTSMQREIELFADDIIRNDRPMVELLTSDTTFVDARLAAHYGLPAPEGDGFEPVVIEDHPRVGLMGKAGLLTALSFPKRTSPVKRGAWVMEHLLCEAPPPAPANVEGLPEDEGEGLSLRERMERHRADPACATCHRVMDPIGFSMEHYDAVGAWRMEDDEGNAIDAAGTWPGGPQFEDAADLSYELAEDSRVPRCMVQKTFAYAMGRPAGIEDIPYLERMESAFAVGEHRFSALARAIVLSDTFRTRRGEPEEGE